MRDDRVRLEDMLAGIDSALAFVKGRKRESLDTNRLLRGALLHELSVVGEAASRVSAELKDSNPQIPWRAISDFRNQIVHSYFALDLDIVWETVATDLVELRSELLLLIERIPK